jgi:hypothetical protein
MARSTPPSEPGDERTGVRPVRPLATLSRIAALFGAASWIRRRRFVLASAVAFLRSVPSRIRAKRWEDLALGLRAHAVLLADPTTATASLRVGSVGNHVVVLEGQSGRPAELARSAIGRLSGVIDVRLEPVDPRVAPSA